MSQVICSIFTTSSFLHGTQIRILACVNVTKCIGEVKWNLQFLAPSAGIAEVAKHDPSPRPLVMMLKCWGPTACKIRGLHHCTTTPSASYCTHTYVKLFTVMQYA